MARVSDCRLAAMDQLRVKLLSFRLFCRLSYSVCDLTALFSVYFHVSCLLSAVLLSLRLSNFFLIAFPPHLNPPSSSLLFSSLLFSSLLFSSLLFSPSPSPSPSLPPSLPPSLRSPLSPVASQLQA